jgi:anti-sigma factor RsiW
VIHAKAPDDMTDTELIDAYLNNELSPEDRAKVDDRLQRDANFQEEFAWQKALIGQLRAKWAADKMAQFAEWDRETVAPGLKASVGGGRPLYLRWAAAAAVVSLVVGFGWYFFRKDTETLPLQPVVARLGLDLPLRLRPGEGLAGNAAQVIQQPVLLDTADATHPFHYRFLGDTLELFVRGASPAQVRAGWRLVEQTPNLTYLLLNDSLTFSLEKGRGGIFPLKK